MGQLQPFVAASYERLELAKLPGRHGAFLTCPRSGLGVTRCIVSWYIAVVKDAISCLGVDVKVILIPPCMFYIENR